MSSLEASLRLDIAQYQAQLAKARGEAKKFKDQLAQQGGFGKLLAGAELARGVRSLVGYGREALNVVVSMDRMRRAMTTLEGSAQGAEKRLELLRETAKLPGIGFEQAVQGDVRLRSVGLSAEMSRQALIEFGNALALSGGTAADLDGVILALGQIASKGKVSAEEINQIAERVPQIRKVMKDVFGTADTEAIQKMGISAEDFIGRTIAGFGQLDRASAGLDEKLSDIQQSLKGMVVDVAGPLVDVVVPAFADLATTVAENKDLFQDLGSGIAAGAKHLVTYARLMNDIKNDALGLVGMGPREELTRRDPTDATGLKKEFQGPEGRKAMGKLVDENVGVARHQKKENAGGTGAAKSTVDEKGLLALRRERLRLQEQEQALVAKWLQDEMSLLTASDRLKVIHEAMLKLERERGQLVGPGLEDRRLEVESELMDLKRQAREAEKDMAADAEDAARVAMARQVLEMETKIAEAKGAAGGNEEDAKVRAFQDELNVLQLQAEIQEQLKVGAEEALALAQQKVGAERAAANAAKLGQQKEAKGDMAAEMAILRAEADGKRQLAEHLRNEMEIRQEARRIAEATGVSEQQALVVAREKSRLKKEINSESGGGRYDAEGRRADGRKRINAHIDRGDAMEREGLYDGMSKADKARNRVAAQKAQFQDTLYGEATAQKSGEKNPMAGKAAKNAEMANGGGQTGSTAPMSPGAQQVITLVTQILEAVK